MRSNLSCPNENAELFRKQNKDIVGIKRLGSTRNLDKHINPAGIILLIYIVPLIKLHNILIRRRKKLVS